MNKLSFSILLLMMFCSNSYADNKNAKTYYNNALALVKKGNHLKSIDYFTLAMNLDPDNDIPVYGRACAKMNIGDIEGAIMDFSIAIELNPYSYQSYHNLGIIEYNAKNHDAAKSYFLYSTELDPTNVSGLFSLGKIYYELQNIEKALVFYKRAIEINKTLKVLTKAQLTHSYTYIASCLSIKKEFDNALIEVNKAIKTDPENSYSHYIKGAILYELKAFEQAIESYSTSLSLNSDFGYGYFARACAKIKIGDKKGSKKDFAIAHKYGFIAQ